MTRALLFTSLLLAAPLAAQDRDTTRMAPDDSANNTLLDISIDPAANERHVVFLQKEVVYRASFSQAGAVLRMRSLGNKQLPFVVDISNGQDVSGETELEIYPQADGDVELTVVLAATIPVRFRLWSDARATERGKRSAEEGWWELGLDGLLGYHGEYDDDGEFELRSGLSIGGCLSVRNGPGVLGFINGCIVGIEGMPGDGNASFFGAFTEPHLRLSNGRRTDQGWRREWGALVRYSIYEIYESGRGGNFGSGIPGFGAYFARDQRDLSGRGWRFTLTARADYAVDRELDAFEALISEDRHWVPVVQLQVGKYR